MTQAFLEDRYRVDRELARGGMGTIYAAWDERLERRVAIKRPRESIASDPVFTTRFRREAHAVAALSHPNIASIFDYGEHDGAPFIVMELIEGRDLARVLREEGPLSEDRAVWIAAQVCAALGHAHSQGVIHRDVKPGNILVCADERVKVTDFGIARALGDATLTDTGHVFGSAPYISPEQALGQTLTHLTDVYSLGIVLFEMLTGATPFQGDAPLAIAMRHVNEELPRPSELNPAVSPALDAVVATATARSPEARYSTCAAFADALRAASPRGSAWEVGTQAVTVPDATTRDDATPVLPVSTAPASTSAHVGSSWRRLNALPVRVQVSIVALAGLIFAVVLVGSLQADAPNARGDGRRESPSTSTDRLPRPLERDLRNLEELVQP